MSDLTAHAQQQLAFTKTTRQSYIKQYIKVNKMQVRWQENNKKGCGTGRR